MQNSAIFSILVPMYSNFSYSHFTPYVLLLFMFDWRMSAFQPLFPSRSHLTNRNGMLNCCNTAVKVCKFYSEIRTKALSSYTSNIFEFAILIERHFTALTGNLMFASICQEFFDLPFGIGKFDSVLWATFQYIECENAVGSQPPE